MSLGDGENYTQYALDVAANGGGVVTKWPFDGPGSGSPCGRWTVDAYTTLVQNGVIDPSVPAALSGSGDYVYVLAPSSVIESLPTYNSIAQSFLNWGFTQWDDVIGYWQQNLPAIGHAIASGVENLASVVGSTASNLASPLLLPIALVVGAAVVGLFIVKKLSPL